MTQDSRTSFAGEDDGVDGHAGDDRLSPAAALATWIGLSILGWAAVIGLLSMVF